MSKDQTAYTQPSELPADALISFDQFAPSLPGMTREWVHKASREGRFVPGIRLSERKPMLFKAGAVAAWLAERTAALEVSK